MKEMPRYVVQIQAYVFISRILSVSGYENFKMFKILAVLGLLLALSQRIGTLSPFQNNYRAMATPHEIRLVRYDWLRYSVSKYGEFAAVFLRVTVTTLRQCTGFV